MNNGTNSKINKLKPYYFGIFAEYIAIIFLCLKGYKFVKRGYKSIYGEIDIILSKKDTIIAVEVKARKKVATIEELVCASQQKRINNSIEFFVSRNRKYKNYAIRVDLLVIELFKKPLHLKGYL